jgi:hypothetical protein
VSLVVKHATLGSLAGLLVIVWFASWSAPWPVDHLCALFSAPLAIGVSLVFVLALSREG